MIYISMRVETSERARERELKTRAERESRSSSNSSAANDVKCCCLLEATLEPMKTATPLVLVNDESVVCLCMRAYESGLWCNALLLACLLACCCCCCCCCCGCCFCVCCMHAYIKNACKSGREMRGNANVRIEKLYRYKNKKKKKRRGEERE